MKYILAIESSCDETAATICTSEETTFSIIAEKVSSQTSVHIPYAGVVPELAAREHLRNLPLVIQEVLTQANCNFSQIGHIVVTGGPGLLGCLLVGNSYAEGLSLANSIPLILINHIEAHVWSCGIENSTLEPPFLGIVVSGGHSEIVLVKSNNSYEVITRTLDDAAGEAFDKCASLLGFNYPGGSELARWADNVSSSNYVLPTTMIRKPAFSFAGLKTAALLLIKKISTSVPLDSEVSYATDFGYVTESDRHALCFAIQDAIVSSILLKVNNAIKITGIKKICLSGGVAANLHLRNKLSNIPDVDLLVPATRYCTDNATMVAYLGWRKLKFASNSVGTIKSVRARWPIEEIN
jgi:N6-L-threonylcarbamoyladenine synthase